MFLKKEKKWKNWHTLIAEVLAQPPIDTNRNFWKMFQGTNIYQLDWLYQYLSLKYNYWTKKSVSGCASPPTIVVLLGSYGYQHVFYWLRVLAIQWCGHQTRHYLFSFSVLSKLFAFLQDGNFAWAPIGTTIWGFQLKKIGIPHPI
jgi:hypothetical protein